MSENPPKLENPFANLADKLKHYLSIPKTIQIQKEKYLDGCNGGEREFNQFLYTQNINLVDYEGNQMTPFAVLVNGNKRSFAWAVGEEISRRILNRKIFEQKLEQGAIDHLKRMEYWAKQNSHENIEKQILDDEEWMKNILKEEISKRSKIQND
jgi:hypothetical protein